MRILKKIKLSAGFIASPLKALHPASWKRFVLFNTLDYFESLETQEQQHKLPDRLMKEEV